MAEGGEGCRGAGSRKKQVQLLLLEAGRLEAALEEEDVWPRGADGSCLEEGSSEGAEFSTSCKSIQGFGQQPRRAVNE